MSYEDFNPSGFSAIDAIKAKAKELREIIENGTPKGAMKDRALMDLRSATMFAVGSLFE